MKAIENFGQTKILINNSKSNLEALLPFRPVAGILAVEKY